MTTYDLYLDHGPKRKKTMVHVIDLMGCVHNGPTTDQVLDETPEAIRGFLAFLAEHGDPVDPEAPFDVRIAEEITEGQWLGQGIEVFGPDHDPIKPAELKRLVTRHGWIRESTLELVGELSVRQLSGQAGERPTDRRDPPSRDGLGLCLPVERTRRQPRDEPSQPRCRERRARRA